MYVNGCNSFIQKVSIVHVKVFIYSYIAFVLLEGHDNHVTPLAFSGPRCFYYRQACLGGNPTFNFFFLEIFLKLLIL